LLFLGRKVPTTNARWQIKGSEDAEDFCLFILKAKTLKFP